MLLQRFVGPPGQRICIVIHWWSSATPSVVICPSLVLTKSGSQSLLSAMARSCHQLGMNVFLFDYLGEGDSDGDYKDVTATSLLSSAQRVIGFAKGMGCTNIGLVGCGVGNLVACYLARHEDVGVIALFWPDLSAISAFPQGFSQDELTNGQRRGYLATVTDDSPQGRLWRALLCPFDDDEFGPVSYQLLHQLAELKPDEQLVRSSQPVLVVRGGPARAQDWVKRLSYGGILEELGEGQYGWPAEPESLHRLRNEVSSWLRLDLAPSDVASSAPPRSSPLPEERSNQYSKTDEVETQTFSFGSGGQTVLGVLHTPPLRFGPKRPCVIFETGLGGERVGPCCCGPKLAKALAASGFYVLRYDNRGSGVSEGEILDLTWSRRIQDLNCALKQLARLDQIDIDQVALVAYSAGAKVACYVANRADEVKACVLWSPDLLKAYDGPSGGQSTRFRRHLTGKLFLPLEALTLGMDYFVDARQYDFAKEFEQCRKPMLIIEGQYEESPLLKQFFENMRSEQPEKRIVRVPSKHTFLYEVLDSVIESSVAWLVERVNQPKKPPLCSNC